MRMRQIAPINEQITLEIAAGKFIAIKRANKLSAVTLRDYENQIGKFIRNSQNNVEYTLLEQDTLRYFAEIPDTSPARYNKPYQYLSAFFNWMVSQRYIPKNPIIENGLKKRLDEGNIKPASVENLRNFMQSLDKHSYTDLRTYTIILVMMDCGIRTKELLSLHESDFNAVDGTLRVSKIVAKTRRERILYLSTQSVKAITNFLRVKPRDWADWLFPNYEGNQLTTTYLDKAFAKTSAKCGIKITPYQLRHSFATLYLKNGGDLFT